MTSSSKILTPTVQHNIPISQGGEHELDNISVICLSCNTSIQDQETGELNQKEVIETWERIVKLEKENKDWFWNLELLEKCQSDDSQMSVQVRLGKDRIGKVNNKEGNKFVKPTIEEIQEYCLERKNGINANAFYDFYESKNWMIGKNKMKDWKACIRTWEQRNKKEKQSSKDFDRPAWLDMDL